MESKIVKFRPYLIDLILKGEKTSTWRLFDDKNLSVGDEITLMNWTTKEIFAKATITKVKEKTLGTLQNKDWQGHEKFNSEKAMYKEYQKYYPNKIVNENTIVKMIWFEIR
jgi:hypothetical protein